MILNIGDVKATGSVIYYVGVLLLTSGWYLMYSNKLQNMKDELLEKQNINEEIKKQIREYKAFEDEKNNSRFKGERQNGDGKSA